MGADRALSAGPKKPTHRLKAAILRVYLPVRRAMRRRPRLAAYPDDTYVVGYPKSGNTWLLFLIGNYLTDGRCDWTNCEELMPGIVEHPDLCRALARPRVLHTHVGVREFQRLFRAPRRWLPRVVFIARDGRDVAVSYYYYLQKCRQIAKDMPFAEYLAGLNRGAYYPRLPWGPYVRDWLERYAGQGNLLLVRYEDLRRQPEELARVLAFMGLPVDGERVAAAVRASSLENMAQLEGRQRSSHYRLKDSDPAIPFVRSGKSGQWQEHFSPERMEAFLSVHGEALDRLGYAPFSPWEKGRLGTAGG